MIATDWGAVALGMAAGMVISGLYFGGLAYGLQRALHSDSTIKVLAISALMRIGLFMGVGLLVLTQAGPWAFSGYAVAFFAGRRIATALAGIPATVRGAK